MNDAKDRLLSEAELIELYLESNTEMLPVRRSTLERWSRMFREVIPMLKED